MIYWLLIFVTTHEETSRIAVPTPNKEICLITEQIMKEQSDFITASVCVSDNHFSKGIQDEGVPFDF